VITLAVIRACAHYAPLAFERRLGHGSARTLAGEVLAVGLTWRDLVSSATIVTMIVAFMAFRTGADLPLLSSAWTASVVEIVLGCICAVSAAGDLHTRPQPREGVIFRRVTTVLGTIALLAGLIALIADSGHALEILVVITGFLWLTATIWHVLTIGSEL
jgi:hypothetical protein